MCLAEVAAASKFTSNRSQRGDAQQVPFLSQNVHISSEMDAVPLSDTRYKNPNGTRANAAH